MTCASTFLRGLDFIPPKGVVVAKLDSITELRVGSGCKGRGQVVTEVFVEGTEPDWLCSRGGVDQESGQQREVRTLPEVSATSAETSAEELIPFGPMPEGEILPDTHFTSEVADPTQAAE